MGGAPSAARPGGVRAESGPRRSGEMVIPSIEEDVEEEEEEVFDGDVFVEEVDDFGPRLVIPTDHDASAGAAGGTDTEPVSPLSPLPSAGHQEVPEPTVLAGGGVPLTAHALARMEEEDNEGKASIEDVKSGG